MDSCSSQVTMSYSRVLFCGFRVTVNVPRGIHQHNGSGVDRVRAPHLRPAFTAQTVPTRWGTSGLVIRALKSGRIISMRGCGSVLRLVVHVKGACLWTEHCSAHYTVCSASWCHVLPRSSTHMHLAAVTHGHQCAELGHDDDGCAHITCHWL